MLPVFLHSPSFFPVSVTVYCIVGSFTRHLLLSLYSDAMYRTLLQFLYQIFSFLLLFVVVVFRCCWGGFFYIGIVYHLYFWMSKDLFFFFWFVCFRFMNLEISSQKRTERRETVLFLCRKKIVLICFNIIISRHLNKRRVIILCCFLKYHLNRCCCDCHSCCCWACFLLMG